MPAVEQHSLKKSGAISKKYGVSIERKVLMFKVLELFFPPSSPACQQTNV